MKNINKPTQKILGVSIIEVVISMLILGAGVRAYTQSHSNQIAAGLDNLERQQAALIASDISNIIAAHVNLADPLTARSDIENRIKSISNNLLQEAKKIATERGYSCENFTPRLKAKATNATTTTATALQPWVQGPAFCLKIEIPANQVVNNGFNGVWVQTTLYWLPIKRADNTADNISISSLVAPM